MRQDRARALPTCTCIDQNNPHAAHDFLGGVFQSSSLAGNDAGTRAALPETRRLPARRAPVSIRGQLRTQVLAVALRDEHLAAAADKVARRPRVVVQAAARKALVRLREPNQAQRMDTATPHAGCGSKCRPCACKPSPLQRVWSGNGLQLVFVGEGTAPAAF